MSTSVFSRALSPDAKMLNRVAQGRLPFDHAIRWFDTLPESERPSWLKTIAFMCRQAHPRQEEVDAAIALSGLKPTFTPCVMLRSAAHIGSTLDRIASLRPDEEQKAFQLLLALYCVADTRRRQTACRDGCSHSWHNLGDDDKSADAGKTTGTNLARIEVTARHNPLAFFYLAFIPTIAINGEKMRRPWGVHFFDVPPGEYNVAVSYPWLIPECGKNSVRFTIAAGETKKVKYCARLIRFWPGAISVSSADSID